MKMNKSAARPYMRKWERYLTETEKINRQHQEDLERLKGFRLLDDDFMTKCFEGETACIQLVLRIILEMPDLTVTDVRTQVFVENLLKRSVRLDVLATDNAGRKINVEIQRSDKGAGKKRARYNSSMMDANLLPKGEDFEDLPETYVIFITEHDVLGRDRALYHIGRYIFDTGETFEDGSHILYVNGEYRGETPIGKLMHDFSCTNPSDMHYDVLADRVRFFKESKEGVSIMCRVMEDMRDVALREGLREGRREGRREGIQEGKREMALRMLEAGRYSIEEISELSGLSPDEIRTLEK